MGIFSKLFNIKPNEKKSGGFTQVLNGFTNVFTPLGTDNLQSDIYLSAVQTNANYRGQLKLVHRLKNKEQKRLQQLLQLRPNPLTNITTFLESLSLDYDTYNNAFIYIDYDLQGEIVALWRINPQFLAIEVANNGSLICTFNLQSSTYTVPYSRLVHIARNIITSEIYGDANSAVNKILNIINTNYQGIEAAIKTSGFLRYLVLVQGKKSNRELKELDKQFAKNILNPLNAQAVKHFDSGMTLQELNPAKQIYSNFAEQKLYASQVYNFLGVNEKIINGTATDDEMLVYEDRSVTNWGKKLVQELSYKIFTNTELSFGNKILALPDNSQMSFAKRIEIARMAREVGIYTKGQWADLLFLEIDDELRDEPMPLSQNYNKGVQQNASIDNTQPADTQAKAQ